jgi:hypothetical protein
MTHEPTRDILKTQSLDVIRADIHTQQLEHIASQKEMLAGSPELRQIIGEVAGLRGVSVNTEYEDFAGLKDSMRAVFDFRTRKDGSYGERSEAEENAKEFLSTASDDLKDRIYKAAEGFGLTGDTEPEDPNVKAAVILGGAGKSPLDRTRYAKDLIDEGKLVPEYIVSLGSERPIVTERDKKGENEYDRAGSYSEGAKTEYDLMVAAAKEVFGAEVAENDVVEWTDPKIMGGVPSKHKIAFIPATDAHPPIFIISSAVLTHPFMTRMVEGKKIEAVRNRSNTEDTFATLARTNSLEPGDKVVAVTNAHFRPFQGAAAAGQLGEYGIQTEVVGYDPTRYNNPAKRIDELMQEMLTTADSLAQAA